MIRFRIASFAACTAAAVVLSASVHAAGPSSPYYLTDGDSSSLQVVQSGAIVNSWQTSLRFYPLAVSSTVKVYNRGEGSFDPGVEYALDGTPTGTTYDWQNGPTGQLLDGATDGVNHNYASEWNGLGGVWRYDLDWKNPELLFTLDSGLLSGITYDRADGALWIVSQSGNIQQVTNSGEVISEFSPGEGLWGALAWEPLTDTLWAHANGSDLLRQWDKSGNVLQDVHVPGLSSNIWGGEFPTAVPEPSSWMLAGVGLVALTYLAKRRRKH